MKRNISVDILRFVMACLIVCLHGQVFLDVSPTLSFLFVQGICRIAVPVFLIITGYYFYDVDDVGKFKKYIKRLLLLYLVWMVAYIPKWLNHNVIDDIKTLVFGHFHLWYLIQSVYAIVLVWLFRKYKKVLVILGIVLYAIGVFLQYNYNYHFIAINYGMIFFRNGLTFCFPFITVGLAIRELKNKKFEISKNISVIVSILGVLLLLLESYLNSNSAKPFDLLASLIVISPALFVMALKYTKYSNNSNLSKLSTGMYLIHVYVLDALSPMVDSFGKTIVVVMTILLSVICARFLLWLNKYLKIIL